MHKAKSSDTSFLDPKKLNHGKLLQEQEQKPRSRSSNADKRRRDHNGDGLESTNGSGHKSNSHKSNGLISDDHKSDGKTSKTLTPKSEQELFEPVPVQQILAIITIQEFEELFDELSAAQNDKRRLIMATSAEIDHLRQRIAVLCGETMKRNPSQQSYLQSFLSLFSFGSSVKKGVYGVEPFTACCFSDPPEVIEERIRQIKRTKFALIRQTAKEMDQLRNIIRCLEHINHEADQKRRVSKSTWNFLWWMLAAVAIGFTIPAI